MQYPAADCRALDVIELLQLETMPLLWRYAAEQRACQHSSCSRHISCQSAMQVQLSKPSCHDPCMMQSSAQSADCGPAAHLHSLTSSMQIPAAARTRLTVIQGTYYMVAAADPVLRQVTLTAAFWKVSIGAVDSLAGYSDAFQPLGTVRHCSFGCWSRQPEFMASPEKRL